MVKQKNVYRGRESLFYSLSLAIASIYIAARQSITKMRRNQRYIKREKQKGCPEF